VAPAASDVLFRQGDEGDFVYVVRSGEIELVRERADGSEEILGRVGEGQYFGELAPLFGIRRSAGARAVTDARVEALTPAAFRRRSRGRVPALAD
jgi:putative ABC transport system ATP-binding protein